ncbi:MAG TPA: hypothetical protein DD640_06110, partial [Clostridiales bacterium]|nr:hypothetical protein [Clostridiales bacterium]
RSFLRKSNIRGKDIACFYCHAGGADKADRRSQTLVDRDNRFIGSFGLQDVASHPEESCAQAIDWARKLG